MQGYIQKLNFTDQRRIKRRFFYSHLCSRQINFLVIHCTAGNIHSTAEQVQNFFLKSKKLGGRGWKTGGYHIIIEQDGTAVHVYEDQETTNGTKAYAGVRNSNSINIALTGGLKWDEFTFEQRKTLAALIHEYCIKYPGIKVLGHNQINNKACPTFDVRYFAAERGIRQENIFHHDTKGVLHWMNQVKDRYT